MVNSAKASPKLNRSNLVLTSPKAASDYFMDIWDHESIDELERVYLILLDENSGLIHTECIGIGNLNSCFLDVKRVLKLAILHEAYSVAIAHNHPKRRVANPSDPDIIATEELYTALKMLDIELFDHLIITSSRAWCSMRKCGFLDKYEKTFKNAWNACKPGTYENTTLKIVDSFMNQMSCATFKEAPIKFLTSNLEKVYIKFFDPIV